MVLDRRWHTLIWKGPRKGAACATALGAKLGAILCGLVWTAVDAGGIESLVFRAVWTAVDVCGHGV